MTQQIDSETGEITEQRTDNIAAALAKAQGEMKNAPLNRFNPHYKTKYADLASIRDATIPALSKHGLAIVQIIQPENGGIVVRTCLMHSSGQALESVYPVALGKPQETGSALTYARRYSWSSICGISADDDDDGNAAKDTKPPARQTKPTDEPQEHYEPEMPDEFIPVPDGPDDAARWKRWTGSMIRAVNQQDTLTGLNKLLLANNAATENLKKASAAAYKTLDDAVENMKAQFGAGEP